jgi:hypothetical protein
MSSITDDRQEFKALLKEALLDIIKEKDDTFLDALDGFAEKMECRDSNVDCRGQKARRFKVMLYADYEKNPADRYEKGVLTITLSHWNEFNTTVQKLQDYKDYIWRGHRCDRWCLVSRFDRLFPGLSRGKRQKCLDEHLRRFRLAIRGRRGSNPARLGDRRCWALGQHYGLITPLLDWTDSPFVAAYFAFFKDSNTRLSDELVKELEDKLETTLMTKMREELRGSSQTEYRSVYALNRDLVRWGVADTEKGPVKERFVEFVDDMSDENPRLVSQGGQFTISLDGEDIKKRVQSCYNWNPKEDRIILMEIKIPNKNREEFLKSLNQMNISHLSLFPDLYGAAKSCNARLDIKD